MAFAARIVSVFLWKACDRYAPDRLGSRSCERGTEENLAWNEFTVGSTLNTVQSDAPRKRSNVMRRHHLSGLAGLPLFLQREYRSNSCSRPPAKADSKQLCFSHFLMIFSSSS